MSLIMGSTTELWLKLLRDGEQRAHVHLPDSQESYLVFTLIRLSRDALLAGRAVAIDLLDADAFDGATRTERLRDAGDRCLLLAGLFPDHAIKRGLSADYYAAVGESAYARLGDRDGSAMASLYAALARAFDRLIIVLRSIRPLAGGPVCLDTPASWRIAAGPARSDLH